MLVTITTTTEDIQSGNFGTKTCPVATAFNRVVKPEYLATVGFRTVIIWTNPGEGEYPVERRWRGNLPDWLEKRINEYGDYKKGESPVMPEVATFQMEVPDEYLK